MNWLVILGVVILLFGLAIFAPSNTLTGRIVDEPPCEGIGCVELCDEASACGQGLTCCQTHWETGVCDYSINCEEIRQYSLYQSLEMYEEGNQERPAPLQADWKRFFLPLLVSLGILVFFIFKRGEVQ